MTSGRRAQGPIEHRGAATVLAVAMAGVLLLVGAAAGVVAALVVAHRQAQAAADLAALAGAAAAAGHSGRDPCRSAAAVAAENDAEMSSCEVAGGEVVVAVIVTGPRWLGQQQDLRGRARAGPVR